MHKIDYILIKYKKDNNYKKWMVEILSIFMGIMDIIAGIIILLVIGANILGVVFGLLMIGKGFISFV